MPNPLPSYYSNHLMEAVKLCLQVDPVVALTVRSFLTSRISSLRDAGQSKNQTRDLESQVRHLEDKVRGWHNEMESFKIANTSLS